MRKSYYKPLIIIALSALVGLPMIGCEEDELYTLSQEEEIERFVDDSDIGKAFFADGQFADTVMFTFPDDDAIYFQTFDSSRRSVTPLNLGSLLELETGDYYFSNTTVTDWLYHTLHKELSDQVTQHHFSKRLTRDGLLVKLGSNGQAYSGWLLQGFADTSSALYIQTLDGSALRLDNVAPLIVAGTDLTLPDYRDSLKDRDYMDIDNASTVDGASAIAFSGCEDCVTIAYYETDSGFAAQVVPDAWTASPCYTDTVGFGEGSDVVWTSLSLQTICKVNDSTFTSSIRCVPFKVNH